MADPVQGIHVNLYMLLAIGWVIRGLFPVNESRLTVTCLCGTEFWYLEITDG